MKYLALSDWCDTQPRVIGLTPSRMPIEAETPIDDPAIETRASTASERAAFFTRLDAGALADRFENLLGRPVSEPMKVGGYITTNDPLKRNRYQVRVTNQAGDEEVYDLGQIAGLLWSAGVGRPGKVVDGGDSWTGSLPWRFVPDPEPVPLPAPTKPATARPGFQWVRDGLMSSNWIEVPITPAGVSEMSGPQRDAVLLDIQKKVTELLGR